MIKEIEEFGFIVNNLEFEIEIYNKDDIVCTISKEEEFVMNTDYIGFKELDFDTKSILYCILYKYISTPIMERKI